MDRPLDLLRSVLVGLAAGADPSRLLHDGVAGAVAATGGGQGAVVRLGDGVCTTLAAVGPVSFDVVAEARGAADSGRLVVRRDPATGVTTAAEPLRAGSRVVGAVVVGGSLDRLDPSALPLFAAALANVVQRHAAPAPEVLPELVSSLAAAAGATGPAAVAQLALDGARALLGAASGLCALSVDGVVRVARFRGIDPERLASASRHPEFRRFLSGSDLRVDDATHPIVQRLALLGEVAVGVGLSAGGRQLGRLVLLLPSTPGPAERSMLSVLGRHVAVCMLAGDLGRAVTDQQHRLSSLAHAVSQPVVVVDTAGRLTEANGAAAEVFSLAPGFERAERVEGLLGHPELENMLASRLEGTVEVVVGASEPRVYRATVRRTRTSGGEVDGAVLMLDDVTGQREVDALKADFVAVIGHELRTPITVVKGYLKTLLRRGATLSEERRAQALTVVESNVSRLERLIEDLLFLSAIDRHTAAVDVETRDVAELLRRHAGPRVVVRAPARAVELPMDEEKLAVVVHHLLANALEYSDGEVAVELVERDQCVEVSVIDSGPGIFSGDVPLLFERFRQLDGSSTRAHGGVGIGLYICRRVVEALGGTIWCESRLGVGSRFTFSLPTTNVATAVAPL